MRKGGMQTRIGRWFYAQYGRSAHESLDHSVFTPNAMLCRTARPAASEQHAEE